MSLRTRFIALFTLLAVIPLLGVGIFSYFRSMRAVEALVATEVEEIARSAARQVEEAYADQESNLLLLAENAETQTLFAARATGDSAGMADALSTAGPYLEHAWRVLGDAYQWIEFRERSGQVLYRMGDVPDERAAYTAATASWQAEYLTFQQAIRDPMGQQEIGSVLAAVNPEAVLPFEALETRFGSGGYSVVVDRSSGRILYHPSHAFWRRTLGELAGPGGWNVDLAVIDTRDGIIKYRENDTRRVAFFESLESPAWTVLASGSVDEFGAPFARTRAGNLLLILALALAVAAAYALLTRQATHSLVVLTHAADQVGAGDLSPELPDQGKDEVGRLTGAFRVMLGKVRESLQQMEASRQMAAVGQFASQISHEIRNPLTSMKLNLQGLERDVENGRIPPESARPVELCLKEVQRLDRVVGGVLNLARTPSGDLRPCEVHGVIDNALKVLLEQLEHAGVRVQKTFCAGRDTINGDPEALESVFINLFLNAMEAMPDGGVIEVSTESSERTPEAGGIRIRVADDGSGIPPEEWEEIFKPFFSTKKGGTGLGLSLAARIVESHRGVLKLGDAPASGHGSVFVVELPLAASEDGV